MENIRLVEINTTAFEEENIMLITDLTDEQIQEVITPIVLKERNDEVEYDNDTLCEALREKYPTNIVIDYATDSFDKITI
jgi:hypothetical protein